MGTNYMCASTKLSAALRAGRGFEKKEKVWKDLEKKKTRDCSNSILVSLSQVSRTANLWLDAAIAGTQTWTYLYDESRKWFHYFV